MKLQMNCKLLILCCLELVLKNNNLMKNNCVIIIILRKKSCLYQYFSPRSLHLSQYKFHGFLCNLIFSTPTFFFRKYWNCFERKISYRNLYPIDHYTFLYSGLQSADIHQCFYFPRGTVTTE